MRLAHGPAQRETFAMDSTGATPPPTHRNAVCPFCGLLCDGLTVEETAGRLRVIAGGCTRADAGFGQTFAPSTPMVDGAESTLDAAVQRAAVILRQAALALYGGMATDVDGARAVLDLADRTGGIVDHMHGDSMLRNILAVQDAGWMVTTLTEVRNRADLLVFMGTDAVARCPRFFDRLVWNHETMFDTDPGTREVVYLGRNLDTAPGAAPDGRAPTVIPCDPAHLGEVAGVLRALLAERPIQASDIAGITMAELRALAARMQKARYGVLAWSAGDLVQPYAELTVEAICGLVKDLNRTTRFSGLPLGGEDGATTFTQVCTWQTGYPLRVGFGHGHPVYDPWRFGTAHLLADGGVDALLWTSAFSSDAAPPGCTATTIVLGRPGMTFAQPPAVYVPVGTPGLDHAGQLSRVDSVVTLPLRQLRDVGLPSVAQVVRAIHAAL